MLNWVECEKQFYEFWASFLTKGYREPKDDCALKLIRSYRSCHEKNLIEQMLYTPKPTSPINDTFNPLSAKENSNAEDNLFLFLIFFRENNAWHYMWIVCQADDSHVMSSIIFFEKCEKKKQNKTKQKTCFENVICQSWLACWCTFFWL